MEFVWVFCGQDSQYPGGIFLSVESAERWIAKHRLTGMLIQYPVNEGLYDWVVSQDLFRPKRESQKTSHFIGTFTSAHARHFHYENGVNAHLAGEQQQVDSQD